MTRLAFYSLILILIIAISPVIASAEISISGFLENQERVRIARDEDAEIEDQFPFDIMMVDTWLDFNVRGTGLDGKARMYVDMDLRYFALERQEEVEVRLREAWAGYFIEHFSFVIGKKIYIWGLADEMNPTDLINAEDLRWFYTYDKPARKIGAYNAAASVTFGNFKLEGIWIPIFTPTKFPDTSSDWLPWKLALFYKFVEQFPEYVNYMPQCLPKDRAKNSSGAIRFSGVAGPIDFEIMAYDGWDHFPYFDVLIDTNPDLLLSGGKPLVLREEYQRFNAFGGSLSGVIGPTTFRLEGAYYTEKYFMYKIDESLLSPQNELTAFNLLREMEGTKFSVQKSNFNVVGGLDYRYSDLLYMNFQYFHQQILDYEERLLDQEIENGVSGKLEFSFLDETLKVATNGAINISHEDWFINPYIAYLLTDSLKIEGGATIFGGDYETNFGEFDRNDYAYTKLRFSF